MTAPKPGTKGLSFGFSLSQDASVRYEIQRRNGSPRRSSCPGGGGTKAGRYTSVSTATEDARAGKHDTTLATAASRRRVRGRLSLKQGRRRIALARIAGGRALAPGTYILRMTATNANGRSSRVKVKFWVLGPNR